MLTAILIASAFMLLLAGSKGAVARPSTEGARDLSRAQAEKWIDAQMSKSQSPLVLNIKKREASSPWILDGAAPIDGVEYRYVTDDKGVRDLVVTPNMLVLLVRLSRFLRTLGVTRVYHAGIFPGKSPDPTNAHNRGEAIDLSSFVFSDGDRLSVLEDWGKKPKPVHVAPSIGGVKGENYRLLPTERGYGFFKLLYSFLSQEATDRGTVAGKSLETTVGTKIGESSYIITPDHPRPDLAAAHADHVHAQVGPTSYGH